MKKSSKQHSLERQLKKAEKKVGKQDARLAKLKIFEQLIEQYIERAYSETPTWHLTYNGSPAYALVDELVRNHGPALRKKQEYQEKRRKKFSIGS